MISRGFVFEPRNNNKLLTQRGNIVSKTNQLLYKQLTLILRCTWLNGVLLEGLAAKCQAVISCYLGKPFGFQLQSIGTVLKPLLVEHRWLANIVFFL